MLIIPVPGVPLATLRTTLVELRHSLVNTQQAGPMGAMGRAQKYLEWFQDARRRLRNQIRPAGLEYLLPSKSYELMLAAVAAHVMVSGGDVSIPAERVLNGLVAMEAEERAQVFDAAGTALDQEVRRFGREHVQLVVLDTNIYMHHEKKLEDMDLAAELALGISNIGIVVPMVVIDELDRGKLSGGDRGYRAGYSVSYIDRMVQAGGRIRAADYSKEEKSRGEVTIEVLLDPPGHVRLPINDDEIVARTVALEILAGRPVRLVTGDTGMAIRARAAGLRVTKLELPKKGEHQKQKRQPADRVQTPREKVGE